MATYLDEGMDIVASLPGEVQRAMTLIRELDGSATKLLDALKRKQTDYIKRVRAAVKDKPKTPGTDLRALSMDKQALAEIESMREEVLQKAEEKLALAEQVKHLLNDKLGALDKHMMDFEQQLRSSGGFETRGLPEGTPVSQEYGSSAKRSRYGGADDYGMDGAAMSAAGAYEAMRPGAGAGSSSGQLPAAIGRSATGSSVTMTQYAARPTAIEHAKLEAAHRATAVMDARASAAYAGGVASASSSAAAAAASVALGGGAPSDERYCLCNGTSHGEMVGCDNDDCVTGNGWFHLGCVGLAKPPPEAIKWYCPTCRPVMEGRGGRHG